MTSHLFLQMVFSDNVKLRILHYHLKGYTTYTVAKFLLKEEGIKVSVFGVSKFYKEGGSIARKPGSGRLSHCCFDADIGAISGCLCVN